MWNILFLITGIIFLILLLIMFFSKEVINSKENTMFKYIIIVNGIEYLMEIPLQAFVKTLGIDSVLVDAFSRLYLIAMFGWFTVFSVYTFIICLSRTNTEKFEKEYNVIKMLHVGAFVAGALMLFFVLPIEKFYNGTKMYSYGPAVETIKVFLGIYMLIWVILLIKNARSLRSKKYIPIFAVIILLLANAVIQSYDPSILIANMVGTFICYTMYFTIENPDMKMLNEMYKNKELMEQGYEDKYNFLFEMTQEARGPLVNINNLSSALRMEDDPKKIKEGLLALNNMVRQLDFSINNILNISSLDVQKIKIVDNKYDLEKLCYDLEVRVKPELKENVKFNLSIPKQLPVLYGDYMKIRQILYSLLINACKNTSNGSINMKVNLIEKYDVARIIFNISDTGNGMPIEKINDILSATGSLEQSEIDNLEKKEFNVKVCQKVVKIMGGNLMIKSNIGEGTEVILTIDQKVYHEKENSILNKYENAVSNYRKVLVVSQNKDKLPIIKRKLSESNITYSNLYYGKDAIDRIKSGKKFDFILVDDEMSEMSGLMTLQGMQKIDEFKTPVIIMLKEDKDHIKDHYLDDGFSDYLLLDNLDSELDRIINKY